VGRGGGDGIVPPFVRVAARSTKRTVAIALAAVLVVAVVFAAVTSGLGPAGVPDGDVAVVDGVDDGTISEGDFQTGLEQSAAELGLPEVPGQEDPQYQQLVDQTMQRLLLAIWVRGESDDLGITTDQTEIDEELATIKEQSFESEQDFQKFLKRSNFTDEDIQDQVELTVLRDKLEADVVPSEPQFSRDELFEIYEVDDAAIEDFYESNPESFAIEESRDVRVILNSSEAKVEQAKTELEADDSDTSWQEVAAKYSQDQASKDRGGLLEGLAEGQNDPALTEQAFAAAEGELVGPFESDRGFYLIQVVGSTEAGSQPIEEASEAIRQQLLAGEQQQTSTNFESDFIDKWTSRTSCAPEAAVSLCRDFEEPEPEQVEGQPLPPPVVTSAPIAPGTSTISPAGSAPTGLPQRPRAIGDECAPADEVETAVAEGTLQEGAVLEPCGPDDAQPPADPAATGELPPGAVPIGPGGTPAPGAAPPANGAAPPAAGAAPVQP